MVGVRVVRASALLISMCVLFGAGPQASADEVPEAGAQQSAPTPQVTVTGFQLTVILGCHWGWEATVKSSDSKAVEVSLNVRGNAGPTDGGGGANVVVQPGATGSGRITLNQPVLSTTLKLTAKARYSTTGQYALVGEKSLTYADPAVPQAVDIKLAETTAWDGTRQTKIDVGLPATATGVGLFNGAAKARVCTKPKLGAPWVCSDLPLNGPITTAACGGARAWATAGSAAYVKVTVIHVKTGASLGERSYQPTAVKAPAVPAPKPAPK